MAALILPPRHHFPRCTFRICRRCDGGDHEEAGGARRFDSGKIRRLNAAADDHGHGALLGEGGDFRQAARAEAAVRLDAGIGL